MSSFMNRMPLAVMLFLFCCYAPGRTRACDTWVALPDATESGMTILGKNSDRTLFDCQPLLLHPRRTWPAGSTIDLGRVTIPQVHETYATLGSSPYWCWGYEEGVNEFGVAIGNEGVFNRVLVENVMAAARDAGPQPGPTGMDLLRLGLERGKTAREALDVITGLLERYGQFGSGIPSQGLAGAYDNSFIIADPQEACVLETAGTRWVARRISQGTASISNVLSIDTEWDSASPDLVEFAVKKGWWPSEKAQSFDFQAAYLADSPADAARAERSRIRASCSASLLLQERGRITPRWMMRIARDRSTTPSIDLPVTASSCVAVLPKRDAQLPVLWWTPAVPSAGCYVPFFVHGARLPEAVSKAGTYGRRIEPPSQVSPDSFSPESYWWQFRDLSDLVAKSRRSRGSEVRRAFDELESAFAAALPDVLAKAATLRKAERMEEAAKVLDSFSANCALQAMNKAIQLRERFAAEPEAEVPAQFKPFVGVYLANFGQFSNARFKVVVRDDKLAVDVPGQMVFELKEPDSAGKWYFAVSNEVAVSFARDTTGRVTGMRMYQAGMTFELPRTGE